MACCESCLGGADQQASPGSSRMHTKTLLVIASSIAGVILFAKLEKGFRRREARHHWDPDDRRTKEIPAVSMKELVDE